MEGSVTQRQIEAKVVKVVVDVARPYAVAESPLVTGNITFTLTKDNSVWEENSHPEIGTFVVLSELRKRDAGWRALKARYLQPSDEGE